MKPTFDISGENLALSGVEAVLPALAVIRISLLTPVLLREVTG